MKRKKRMTQLIDPKKFTHTVGLLRSFFLGKGFDEVHKPFLLVACEDPLKPIQLCRRGMGLPNRSDVRT